MKPIFQHTTKLNLLLITYTQIDQPGLGTGEPVERGNADLKQTCHLSIADPRAIVN